MDVGLMEVPPVYQQNDAHHRRREAVSECMCLFCPCGLPLYHCLPVFL